MGRAGDIVEVPEDDASTNRKIVLIGGNRHLRWLVSRLLTSVMQLPNMPYVFLAIEADDPHLGVICWNADLVIIALDHPLDTDKAQWLHESIRAQRRLIIWDQPSSHIPELMRTMPLTLIAPAEGEALRRSIGVLLHTNYVLPG